MNKSICKNPWCRATYSFEGEMPPGECSKCKSFNNDLSGGVSWVTKIYNDPKDNAPHSADLNQFNSTNKIKYYGK